MRRRTAARSARTGRSWSGRSSFARLPRCAPASDALQAQGVRRHPRAPSTASSGVVTVSRTADPAACSARTTSTLGDAEGEAHRRAAAPPGPPRPCRRSRRRPTTPRPALAPRAAASGSSCGQVRGQRRRVGRGVARDEEVDPERVDAGRPDRRHLVRQAGRRLVPAGQEAQRARPGAPPPRARPSTGHPPWAPPRAASGRAPATRPPPAQRAVGAVVDVTPPPLPTGRYGGQPVDLDLVDTLRSTGAARQFHPEPVDDAVLARLLDTARFAPSGGNRQGWRVIVVKDPATRVALRDLYLSGLVRVPGHGVGRPGALGAGDRPCGGGGGRRQRRAVRRRGRRRTRLRRDARYRARPPARPGRPVARSPRSTATCPATPWPAAPPSTPSSGACCWRRGPRDSAAS